MLQHLPFFFRKIVYRILMLTAGKQILLAPRNASPHSSVYDIEMMDIKGQSFSLNGFRGKRMLIVNTASQCGYAHQFAELEELRKKSMGKLFIIAVPSADFKNQEPLSEQEIGDFCSLNYDVHFMLTAKAHVTGKNRHPLYNWLADPKLNGWNNKEPVWNFCKYLISEDGRLLGFFNGAVSPMHESIFPGYGKGN